MLAERRGQGGLPAFRACRVYIDRKACFFSEKPCIIRASFAELVFGGRCWGVAKLVKAPDFDSGIRRFESFFPSHLISSNSGR